MRALCPTCGLHHEVVRVLDDGQSESGRDVYQVAPLAECTRTWISDRDLMDARARFDQDILIQDDEPD
jgi:hypothetical protein